MTEAKIIAFFNHKGGVSKTTNVFYIGWMLAELGHTVLVADGDPQCNLSGVIISQGNFDKFEEFYKANPEQNIRSGLRPVYEGMLSPIKAIAPVAVPSRKKLFLLPGHLQLSEYDVTLTLAQELTASLQPLKNVPGAARVLLQKTAAAAKAEFVLVDLNPSLSAINQNLLLSADHFVIPNSPDYFSFMALRSLSRVLPRWAEWHDKAQENATLKQAVYPLSSTKPTFAGFLVQNFRQRRGEATMGYQDQIDRIATEVEETLCPALESCGMMLPDSSYPAATDSMPKYCLGKVPDFNTLSAKSHSGSRPVFALTDKQIGHVGTVLKQNQEKRKEFKGIYRKISNRLLGIVQ